MPAKQGSAAAAEVNRVSARESSVEQISCKFLEIARRLPKRPEIGAVLLGSGHRGRGGERQQPLLVRAAEEGSSRDLERI